MNYTCFFCGAALRENTDVCARHDRMLMNPNAQTLKTRPSRTKSDPNPNAGETR